MHDACDGKAERSDAKGLGSGALNGVGKEGSTPLLWLLMNCEQSQNAAGLLVEAGADPHLFAKAIQASPATFAVRNLPAEFTVAMLDAGMDPNVRYENYADSPTLLHKAVMYRNRSAVSHLIRSGASLESRNASGDTPLLFVRANQYDIALLLLEAGANPHARNNQDNGICERMAAVSYTPPEVGPDYKAQFVEKLKETGIDCGSHIRSH